MTVQLCRNWELAWVAYTTWVRRAEKYQLSSDHVQIGAVKRYWKVEVSKKLWQSYLDRLPF